MALALRPSFPPLLERSRILQSSYLVTGFRKSKGELQRSVPSAMARAHRLGHLDQALDGHARGKWATANSQLRTFLEGMLDEIAQRLDPATKSQTSENRRTRLAVLGFLYADLNEWSNDGKNFVNGLMKRLHPQGSHPGLSDEQDSTFRLHTVLLTAHLFLKRFDAWR
jgi:hypothetical protein